MEDQCSKTHGGLLICWRLSQFSALLRHELVKDLVCFYNKEDRKFSYVIQLGRCACSSSMLQQIAILSRPCTDCVCCSSSCACWQAMVLLNVIASQTAN